jgi:hypothetical protein
MKNIFFKKKRIKEGGNFKWVGNEMLNYYFKKIILLKF